MCVMANACLYYVQYSAQHQVDSLRVRGLAAKHECKVGSTIGTGFRRLAAMHIFMVRCRLSRMHGASVVGFSACHVFGFNF
jgi:hypothetical protein